jgi:drug/metabolite transporter (DMT)-like permease
MMNVIWLAPILGALVGAVFLVSALFGTQSAPQQAAGAALAAACCVIPYVFARAVHEIRELNTRARQAAAASNLGSSNTNAAAVIIMIVFVLGVGYILLSSVGKNTGDSLKAAEACREFRPIYETQTVPSDSARQTAAACKEKGYW